MPDWWMAASPSAEAAAIKRDVRGAYDMAAPRYASFIMPTFVPIARRVLALARPEVHDTFPRLWEHRSMLQLRLTGLPTAAQRSW